MSTGAIITPAPKLPFYTRLGNWLKEHFKNLPAEEVQVSSTCNYVIPFIEELDTLADPELAPLVNPILDRIKTGLAAMAVTVQDSSPAGKTNVASIMASIDSNAAALESAFQVKDPATQQRVKGILDLLNGELQAIGAQVATAPKV